MVKVLRVITRLNIGGPAIHTILLSSELNKDGYKDVLVCGKVSESEGDMSCLAKEKGVDPVVIPELGRDISFAKDIKAFFKLLSIIKMERPDIIHTHTAKAGTLGRLAAIFSGVPVKIHTFHGHVFDGYFSPRKARVFLVIERFLGLFTDRVVTVSACVRGDIVYKLKVVDGSKSVVIPLGLELDRFLKCDGRKGAFRSKYGIPETALLVGIIGRLVPIKNHEMFLDAARIAADRRPDLDIRFIVIGNGELMNALKQYADKIGIKDLVLFTGWVDDLESVYADLDIVALTSLNEGTPVSIIEALASGKAVISTAVGGVGDMITDGKNGMLTASEDAGRFADKLVTLLADKSVRSSLGKNGREYARERYSKNRLVGDIKDLYEECLGRKRTNAIGESPS
jgi:glycosyltransferase involved in cell wall biosynthesis